MPSSMTERLKELETFTIVLFNFFQLIAIAQHHEFIQYRKLKLDLQFFKTNSLRSAMIENSSVML